MDKQNKVTKNCQLRWPASQGWDLNDNCQDKVQQLSI